MDFKPKIIAYVCNWCTYAAADQAGMKRSKYPAGVQLIKVMCSGRVDPQFVLKAYREGADGVMVLGCHPGDCHYKEGNYKALKRFTLFKNMLGDYGIDQDRFMLDWVAASEADKFTKVANEMYKKVEELGPLSLK